MDKGVKGRVSVSEPGCLAWIFGSSRSGSTWLLRMLSDLEGVVPDMITLAKGLGAGYQPIGALLVNERIVDELERGSGAFQHGHTYVGHAVACAAALAVQEIIDLLRYSAAERERTRAAQVALSMILLVGAGLLVRSLSQVLSNDRGFDSDRRLFATVSLPEAYPEGRREQLVKEVLTGLQRRPDFVREHRSRAAERLDARS